MKLGTLITKIRSTKVTGRRKEDSWREKNKVKIKSNVACSFPEKALALLL